MHVSQPTVSRVFSSFINSIVSKVSQFIHMPRNEMKIAKNISDFQQIAGMPKVVGVVDRSHISIIQLLMKEGSILCTEKLDV